MRLIIFVTTQIAAEEALIQVRGIPSPPNRAAIGVITVLSDAAHSMVVRRCTKNTSTPGGRGKAL